SLYEKYKDGVGPETQVLSLSMAKPLISILVGSARCKGVIKSLDDKAEIYSPALAGTAYGAASLRSLLTMRSGADYGAGSMGETSYYAEGLGNIPASRVRLVDAPLKHMSLQSKDGLGIHS
ncbi:MAG: hypothetical protein EBY76_12630, partial [Betaproteobacteria bacterium]|nr:hypothetical protein [Betaproteobacteria bacterium]